MASMALAVSSRHFNGLEDKKEVCQKEISRLDTELVSRMQEGLRSMEITMFRDYSSYLGQQVSFLDKEIVEAQKQVDRDRDALLKTKKQLRAMEILEELDQKAYDEEEMKMQMKFMDEIAISRQGRNP
jgi:flagellar export protein FliJ